MSTAKLTEKQRIFCEEYLVNLNATQAAIKAGYSPQTAQVIGAENLKKPIIEEYIQKRMDKRSKKTEITANYVLTTIQETVDRCRQVRPVLDKKGKQIYINTPDGDLVPAFTFEANSVLKGCELLGKHLKLFTEVHELNHTFARMGDVSVDADGKEIKTIEGEVVKALEFDVGLEAPVIEGEVITDEENN